MEQASHFDSKLEIDICTLLSNFKLMMFRLFCYAFIIFFVILVASLLSSLHQLKEENLDLEFSVDRMVQRRDHLLAVRARLLALSSLTVATPTNSNSQTGICKKLYLIWIPMFII